MHGVAVSVVMPVFNAARFLRQAVDSVLRQSEPALELLAFDDGSTDGSRDILADYAAADPRVRVLGGTHHGYSHWLRAGVETAAADFVARMDADDVCHPDRFARQAAALRADPSLVAVGGQWVTIDEDGDVVAPIRALERGEDIDARHLRGAGGSIAHPAVMLRRSAVLGVGNYRTEFEPAEDLDLFLRLAEVGRLANLTDVVLYYREHARSVSRSRQQRQWERASAAVAEARQRRGLSDAAGARPTFPARSQTEADLHRAWAVMAFRAGNYATARKHARRTFRHQPLSPAAWRLLAGASLGAFAAPLYRWLRAAAPAGGSNA